jgi:hypothetical protein
VDRKAGWREGVVAVGRREGWRERRAKGWKVGERGGRKMVSFRPFGPARRPSHQIQNCGAARLHGIRPGGRLGDRGAKRAQGRWAVGSGLSSPGQK